MQQSIPGSAPAGDYLYRATIGDYELGVIWSRDQFDFSKSGVVEGSLGSWACVESSLGTETASSCAEVKGYALYPNVPNPFNPTTTLGFELRDASFVKLSVYDISGRLVTTLVDGWRDAGSHEAIFNGSNLASGVYLYRIDASGFTASGKMVLMK